MLERTRGDLTVHHARRIAATTVTLLITATALTACSPSTTGTGEASKPAATKTEAAESKCAGTFGDVVANKPVTDTRGTYCSVTINPDAAALTDDSAIKADTLASVGATIDQARDVQRKAVTFVADNWVDSPMLEQDTRDGGDAGWKDWVSAHRDSFTPDTVTKLEAAKPMDSQMVYNGYFPGILARDGGPRVSNVKIDVNETLGHNSETDGTPQLAVRMHVVAKYRATDEDTVAWMTKVGESNEADLRSSNPELFDGKGDNALVYDGVVAYGYDISSGLINGNTIKGDLDLAKASA
ncbi:hypothetical protein ACWGJ9_08210 [Curtobacterium citreum]